MLWITKDGKIMDVRQMTDTHLRNAIAYMERRLSAFRADENSAWQALCYLQGEMAQDTVQEAINQLSERCADAKFALDGLRNEQRRR